MQKFKGDDLENKFIATYEPLFGQLSAGLDDFFDGSYEDGMLGDLLHEDDRSPLSNAIRLEIFRLSFNTIYEQFRVAGSFESYLTVFAKIFGDTVAVTFTVPGPGKLQIDIVADQLEEFDFVARHIDNNMYLYDEVIWYDTTPDQGNIVLQTIKGFHSQYELQQMLFEMVPAGVYTEISLTFSAP